MLVNPSPKPPTPKVSFQKIIVPQLGVGLILVLILIPKLNPISNPILVP
jgi:hypothetical protein